LNLANEENLLKPFGDKDLDRLIPEVYDDLKRLAAHYLKSERENHTLHPTELVHEVYLQLIKQHSLDLDDRTHFIGLASHLMRRVLVNHANSRNRQKRGDGKEKISLDEAAEKTLIDVEQSQIDFIALEEVLTELEKRDERQVRIIEMRFFGGLTNKEIAEVLQISERTVNNDWDFARTWLFSRLKT
jgi:RNA polymerase sigma-70 factor, ECF subfamily